MKKLTFLFLALLLLSLASCTADEISTNNTQADDVQQEIDPSKIKPPTGG
ncbi:hypothetical protein [Flavobacterium sp.]|nr:hypothetical protein [Flavobacterium sp.]|tara:strand:+ start:3086 stop:3235 length:150 start_codon:yes stop_codon:yes gene_type:complete